MLNVLAASALVAFAMAWAIGAQDVSNALGTSVGSKALSVRQAIVVGAVFEFLGSLMGGDVATTISKGIISPESMEKDIDLYVLIMFATLAGAFVWLAVATYFGLPVSTTHSLIGSLLGLGYVHVPLDRVNTSNLGRLFLSWVASPVLGLIVSYGIFSVIFHQILTHPRPKRAAQRTIPHFYGFTFGVLTVFLTMKGPAVLQLEPYQALFTGALAALSSSALITYGVTAALSRTFEGRFGAVSSPVAAAAKEHVELAVVDDSNGIAKRAENGHAKTSDDEAAAADFQPTGTDSASENAADPNMQLSRLKTAEVAEAESMFMILMVVTACVVAFAHGSNDVSNSVGPFAAIVEIYTFGSEMPESPRPIPNWILMAGGLGIVVGLATYGHKVMGTVGEKITKLTFTRGFAAQIATAFVVLSATVIGLSVSTTHCLIGAVTGVGLVENASKVNFAVIKRIAMSWIVTMPASAFFSLTVFWAVNAADANF